MATVTCHPLDRSVALTALLEFARGAQNRVTGGLVDSTIAAGMPASLTADGCAALNGPYGSRVAASAR